MPATNQRATNQQATNFWASLRDSLENTGGTTPADSEGPGKMWVRTAVVVAPFHTRKGTKQASNPRNHNQLISLERSRATTFALYLMCAVWRVQVDSAEQDGQRHSDGVGTPAVAAVGRVRSWFQEPAAERGVRGERDRV